MPLIIASPLMGLFFRRKPLSKLHVYVHLPKCAGTTLIHCLARLGKRRLLVLSESPQSKAHARAELMAQLIERKQTLEDLDVISGHDAYFGIHDGSPKAPFYFSVLRDPVARYISHYRHMVDCVTHRQHTRTDHAAGRVLENGKPIGLQQFAERMMMTNVMANYLAAANHPDLNSKRWEVTDPQDLEELALSAIDRLDWVGFVENFPDDLNHLCQQLQIKPVRPRNQSISKVRDEIDEKLLEQIRYNNSIDQTVYDYAMKKRTAVAD